MSEVTVWVVDGYMDCLRERKKSLVEKDAKRAVYPKNIHIFPSANKAAQFMVARAQKDLAVAVNEVNSQEDRVWRLMKKYAAKLEVPSE